MVLSYGYMTVLTNNIYYGFALNKTGLSICNGAILKYDAETFETQIPTPEDFQNSYFEIIEETAIYGGLKALRVKVQSVDPFICFVDNQWDYNNDYVFDVTKYYTEPGERMRIHPLEAGDEFVIGPYVQNSEELVGKIITVKQLADLQQETADPEPNQGWMIVENNAEEQKTMQEISMLKDELIQLKQKLDDEYAKKVEVVMKEQGENLAGSALFVGSDGAVQTGIMNGMLLKNENNEIYEISFDERGGIVVSNVDSGSDP